MQNDSSARCNETSRSATEQTRSEEKAALQLTIEQLVIPRLVMAHCAETYAESECPEARSMPIEEQVVELAAIAVSQDHEAALQFVEAIARSGVSTEAVMLDLIAPAARLLGEDWMDDRRDFTEVTLGLGALHRLVAVFAPAAAPVTQHRGVVLLIAAPGEQHTLGLYITGDFLRKAGWGVQIEPRIGESDLCGFLRAQHTEMLGISVSNEVSLEPLRPLISNAKKASKNPSLALFLGGALDLTEYANDLGVTCCNDPRNAVAFLDRHVSGVRSRQHLG